MPLFVLSPASLAHSALFAGYYTYLGAQVGLKRAKTGLLLGEGGEATTIRSSKAAASQPDPDAERQLKQAVRAHANFSESTPFAFFLIFLAELNGAPTSLVHAAYSALFVARVAHTHGIMQHNSMGIGRVVGAYLSFGITVAAGVYNLNLGWEPLKSFIGFK
ncbi:hypothetical protein ACQY0O_007474 [Thecaphora frezii]